MSLDTQREKYDDASRIKSEPTGLLSRDNRNHRKKQNVIMDQLNAPPGGRLLEVGCGHGLHARWYAQQYKYIGTDLSPSLIKECRRRARAWKSSPEFEVMDALELQYPDDHFDAVVGTAILHHLSEQAIALREWLRVTQPDGVVALMEPNPLFPKDFVETYIRPEEFNKRFIFPWRLRRTLDELDGVSWTVEPRIYTIPWPERLHGLYNRFDALARRLPMFRWGSQMLLIHVEPDE